MLITQTYDFAVGVLSIVYLISHPLSFRDVDITIYIVSRLVIYTHGFSCCKGLGCYVLVL